MRIEGTYTFTAPKELVWSLLHNPEIISRAIPSCQKFDQISSSEYWGSLSISEGPFRGEYNGTIQLINGPDEETYGLNLTGTGLEGTIWAEGTINLNEQNGQTTVQYAGEVLASSSPSAISPRLWRTTANSLIRRFFTYIDDYIRIQTGVYTTKNAERPAKSRQSGIIDFRDRIEEVRQNRRTTLIVVLLIALISFMTLGALVTGVMIIRLAMRFFKGIALRSAGTPSSGPDLPDKIQAAP